MQDNFNIHNWRLEKTINELSKKQLCKECGEGYMEEGQCMECGYMEEGVTFTNKFDDNPKLKGGQKDLPDELQDKIISKEGIEDWQRFYEEGYRAGYEHAKAGVKPMYEGLEGTLQHITRVEEIINNLASNISKNPDIKKESKIGLIQALKELKDHIDDLGATIEQGDEYVADYSRLGDMNLKEDHEVSMAQNSLKSIMSSASQLMNKLGNEERDIPGWIQDHITNAENFIDQAAQGFHELDK